MNHTLAISVALAVLSPPVLTDEKGPDAYNQWPQWRGPLGIGVAPRGNPPVTWSEGKNIRWKIVIPGKGHSTPIIWCDRIFITTAIASQPPCWRFARKKANHQQPPAGPRCEIGTGPTPQT